MIFMTKHASIIVSAIAASALALAGCSNSEQDSAQTNSAQETAVTTPADDSLDFEDGVVRAMAEDAEMTAIFGTLVNESAQDIEIVGFSPTSTLISMRFMKLLMGRCKKCQSRWLFPPVDL